MGGDSDHLGLFVPFSLRIDLLDKMLNFEIADDPTYQGLEIQAFDDAQHGSGDAVFLSRREDGRNDVYRQPGLNLDPHMYEIGSGLGAWTECDFGIARMAIGSDGVDVELRFTDLAGRLIEVLVSDQTPGKRRTAPFLAPMGAAITNPRSLPLVWMSQFDLLHRTGPPPSIRIDGRPATLGRLPAERLLRRHLIKVASDLCLVSVNPVDDGMTLPRWDSTDAQVVIEPSGLSTIIAAAGSHTAALQFDPTFPDLESMESASSMTGDWSLTIDTTRVVAGHWGAARLDREINLEFTVSEGWRPRGLPPLMSTMTRVAPVFRRWPTTYHWTGAVRLDDPATLIANWERTGSDRGASYRSITRSR